MNLPLQSPTSPSFLKLTIIEKHADGTCRVHTHDTINGVPLTITTIFRDEEAAIEDDTPLVALPS